MRNLSKSKLIAFRQCHKRLWLTVHRPELLADSADTQASYRVGHQVGAIAQRLYDPAGKGTVIDAQRDGFAPALERSKQMLSSEFPLFEAGYAIEGALFFADVMLPVQAKGQHAWRLVEVKSSTSVKPTYLDDIAVQAYVARSAGVPLTGVAVAHIDNTWEYAGDGKYSDLLTEVDLTDATFARHDEVKGWVADAQKVVEQTDEPAIRTGYHCANPYGCGFLGYCQRQEPQAEHPVAWLPKVSTKALKAHIQDEGLTELRQVRDELLNDQQQRVKTHTLSGKTYFDAPGAAADLAPHKLPAIFLDFETTSLAIPIWKGTRPYQQIPFQFSAHRLSPAGKLTHTQFLDLSGEDPSRAFAEAVIAACGETEPVFAYNASFESTQLKGLAQRLPQLRGALLGIVERLVDLLPVANKRYYHPSQQGSWSIKHVLPAIAPDLRYDALDGVHDGGGAMQAFAEAIAPETTPDRKAQIEQQLLTYCRLDTYAMVRLWAFFTGRTVPAD